MKEQKLMEEEWDTLIVLDACRYDYFEKVYDDYLDGKLEKRNSKAGATPEWLFKTFKGDYQDMSYFSANPFINSKDISLKDLGGEYDWSATNHFGHIVDSFVDDFNEQIQTVRPGELLERFKRSPKLDRKIIHFMQPHFPYLHPEFKYDFERKTLKEKIDREEKENKGQSEGKETIFRDKIGSFLEQNLGYLNTWRIRQLIGMKPISRWEKIIRKYSLSRLKYFYRFNIETALDKISDFIEDLDGKTIITSDHGECFGEYNMWAHENENHNPILTTVPWLEFKND